MKTKATVLVTSILVVTLCTETLPQEIGPPTTSPDDPPHLVDTCWQCIVGVIVLGVGYIICKDLIHICKKLDRHDNPPCPPPDHHHVAFANLPASGIRYNFGTNNFSAWTITHKGWTNSLCETYTTLQRWTLQTSTNLSGWSDCLTATQWISPSVVVSVFYTNGVAICTNETGECPVPALALSEPQRFFRVVP